VPPETTIEGQAILNTATTNQNTDDSIHGSKDGTADNQAPLPDFNQHTFDAELTNAIEFEKSVQSLFSMNELGTFGAGYDDMSNLFNSPSAQLSHTQDFNQFNPHDADTTQIPTNFNDLQVESTSTINNDQTYTLPTTSQPPANMHAVPPPSHTQTTQPQALTHRSLDTYPTSHSRSSSDDEVMDALSARIGAFQIAEDGQLRYYGATSNLHILHNGLSSIPRALSRSVRTEGEEVLQRAGLYRDIDPVLEKHLEELYFRWEDPAIHTVDEEMYFGAKEGYYAGGEEGNPFYSETLKNAMCVPFPFVSSQ
jgi:hypothetical protein